MFEFTGGGAKDCWFAACCDVDDGCCRCKVMITCSRISDGGTIVGRVSVAMGWAADNGGSSKIGVLTIGVVTTGTCYYIYYRPSLSGVPPLVGRAAIHDVRPRGCIFVSWCFDCAS